MVAHQIVEALVGHFETKLLLIDSNFEHLIEQARQKKKQKVDQGLENETRQM